LKKLRRFRDVFLGACSKMKALQAQTSGSARDDLPFWPLNHRWPSVESFGAAQLLLHGNDVFHRLS
jgi:hypothetical protein